MDLELIPLCRVQATLASPLVVGPGPAGLRVIFDIQSVTVTGERLSGVMKGTSGADWLSISGEVGTLDVRATIETHDGALIFVQYRGRTNVSGGPGSPVYVAPTFETGDPRYAWLNSIQAAGVGSTEGNVITYDWFELR